MPLITAIEPQKNKKNRLNIFLDNQFAFGVSNLSLLKNNLKVGKLIEEKKINQIIDGEEITKLIDLAINFLSYRPRSEKEIYDYLTKKVAKIEKIKFSEAKESHLIKIVIVKLKKYKYINDLEFAKWWIQSRIRLRPKGKRLIQVELKVKGIDENIIEATLKESTAEIDLAKRAVEKKAKRWQNLSKLDFKKKVYQYLTMRGFDFEIIKETFAYISQKG